MHKLVTLTRRNYPALRLIGMIIALFAVSSVASAQAPRTWVEGLSGDDSFPCSRTSPCKTLAGAYAKTAIGGEIDVVDAGAYSTLTITHSISIEAVGTVAGILANPGGNAFTISAGPSDVVVIRGMTIDGLGDPKSGQGVTGIEFTSGGALHVEECTIHNFSAKGIDFNPSGSSALFVKDTMVRDNTNGTNGGGIYIHPQSGGAAFVSIDHCRLENNFFGLRAEDGSKVIVSNTVSSINLHNGFLVFSNGGAVEVNLESVVASGNATNGAQVNGAAAVLRLSNCMIVDNTAMGVTNINGANKPISFGNNRLNGNVGGDGAVNNIGQN